MSREDDWFWFRPAPKKPPPAHGIKVRKGGTTWWGQRWLDALEQMSRGYANRLARGRTYARAGRTHDLEVKAGQVSAKVTGTRTTPYKVRITLARLSDQVWAKAIAAMAAEARFAAELLAGQMPQEIDAAFKQAGASVFPLKAADLLTACSCPDSANPCKHIAATHYVLGEALDRDPFLLFELRGRSREQVLEALRAARAGTDESGEGDRTRANRDEAVPAVSLGRLKRRDYDTPREAFPDLQLDFEAPPITAAAVKQLGIPAGWKAEATPADVFEPVIRRAADLARTMLMADPESGQDDIAGKTRKRRKRKKPL